MCCGVTKDGHYLLAGSSGTQGQGAELTVSNHTHPPTHLFIYTGMGQEEGKKATERVQRSL